MQAPQIESGVDTNGKGEKSQNDANVRKRMTGGAEAMIANATKPIVFLNRRDGLGVKAINMTRSFMTRVLIPEAQKKLKESWK